MKPDTPTIKHSAHNVRYRLFSQPINKYAKVFAKLGYVCATESSPQERLEFFDRAFNDILQAGKIAELSSAITEEAKK